MSLKSSFPATDLASSDWKLGFVARASGDTDVPERVQRMKRRVRRRFCCCAAFAEPVEPVPLSHIDFPAVFDKVESVSVSTRPEPRNTNGHRMFTREEFNGFFFLFSQILH